MTQSQLNEFMEGFREALAGQTKLGCLVPPDTARKHGEDIAVVKKDVSDIKETQERMFSVIADIQKELAARDVKQAEEKGKADTTKKFAGVIGGLIGGMIVAGFPWFLSIIGLIIKKI